MSFIIESSIIIPVYNQWALTEACLQALSDTLEGKLCEIIVIDNASEDATKKLCPLLGKKLFGERFRYHRSETNLNFGPASNLGATMARGEFLIFLNNDTVPLAGWYDPLLQDFATYPDIAATGPLLVYPESEPFGFTVQHLGVFISPALKVGHLYEGIPAASPLAQKRRFFQIITAACMVIRRSLFLEIGKFDEYYINGFEDVDLCTRLWSAGYKMTVNPEAKVVHHTSQTPGRHAHEQANSDYLRVKNVHSLIPDWHIHLANDNYCLSVAPWQTLQGSLPQKQRKALTNIAQKSSVDQVMDMLLQFPLWEEGYLALINLLSEQKKNVQALNHTYNKLWPNPTRFAEQYAHCCTMQNVKEATFYLNGLLGFCKPYEEYVTQAQGMLQWCLNIGLTSLAKEYEAWLNTQQTFKEKHYAPYIQLVREITKNIPFYLNAPWAYTLWKEQNKPNENAAKASVPLSTHEGPIIFSVLMPVYNPKHEHLLAAIESLINQQYPFWELCIADDASTDPELPLLLAELTSKDPRIRVTYRPQNGNIAAATNTALAMASHRYSALMDQDDLLALHAFASMAEAIAAHPDGLLFYSDEDKVDDDGLFFCPHFKNSRWDWELFAGQNFVNHLGVYRTERLREIEGFRDGFYGAQDFDMLLRYCRGADGSSFIHIPKILYHWRAHANSTATSVSVKGDAIENTRKALQSHWDITCPGAQAAFILNAQPLRVQYPLPQKLPAVSLIVDLEKDFSLAQTQMESLAAKAGYPKYEILFLYNETADQQAVQLAKQKLTIQKNIRMIPYSTNSTSAERWNMAVEKALGTIVGFLGKGVVALTENWLKEIVTHLSQPRVGVVGGKMLRADDTLLHGGYLVDATGGLASILCGIPREASGYFAWTKIARTVDALDGLCLFTHKHLLKAINYFDTSLVNTSAIDYCLRLNKEGYRTAWNPQALFKLLRNVHTPWLTGLYVTETAFNQRWHKVIPPMNANLIATEASWILNKNISQN